MSLLLFVLWKFGCHAEEFSGMLKFHFQMIISSEIWWHCYLL